MKKFRALLVFSLTIATGHAGSLRRSSAVRAAFERRNPCPANGNRSGPCPGYIVDHIEPLACGGPDRPNNMQWQTVPDAKAKDRVERRGCNAGMRHSTVPQRH